jgi:hypothetical protein
MKRFKIKRLIAIIFLNIAIINSTSAQVTDEIKEQARINDKFSTMFNFSANTKLPDSVTTILINYAKNKNLSLQTVLKQQFKLKMIYDERNAKEDRLLLCEQYIKECYAYETYMPLFLIQDVKKYILSH